MFRDVDIYNNRFMPRIIVEVASRNSCKGTVGVIKARKNQKSLKLFILKVPRDLSKTTDQKHRKKLSNSRKGWGLDRGRYLVRQYIYL